MNRMFRGPSIVMALLVLGSAIAAAQPAGSNGSLPANSYGGSGIPTSSVQLFTNPNVTLGMSASARYANPSVTDNGLGTYYASTGIDNNPPSPGNPYGRWNFNFFVGGANPGGYNYKLYYEFNGAGGTTPTGYVILGPTPTADSWNLGMDFLSNPSPLPGLIVPPVGSTTSTFDPTANAEYSFSLRAYQADVEIGRTGINVITGTGPSTTVPEPGTYLLMAAGLAGITVITRRKIAA